MNLKKKIFCSLILLTCVISYSQVSSEFGIKAGLNYNSNGDYFKSISNTYENPEKNVGYHIGVFGKIGDRTFFRPELVYTSIKSKYNDDSFSMNKIDAPLLIGTKIIGPVYGFLGPSLQYILKTDFKGIKIDDVEKDFTIGAHFGLGVNFNNIYIDVRYERGFTENEATFIANNSGSLVDRIDTRPNQLIVSIAIAL